MQTFKFILYFKSGDSTYKLYIENNYYVIKLEFTSDTNTIKS